MTKWRIAVVGIFTVSAVITPPDMLSMIALALPLIVLYATAIMMVRFVEMRQQKKKDSDLCMT
jgi:sec-independent protein translocase protein TatC